MAEAQRFVRTDAASGGTRRVIERIASNVPATWNCGDGNVSCRLMDVAPTGARLKVRDPDEMPHIFKLYVPDFQMLYEVETRWRREGHVGVMFLRAWRQEH